MAHNATMRRLLRYIYHWLERESRNAPGAWMWRDDFHVIKPWYTVRPGYLTGLKDPEPEPEPESVLEPGPEIVRMYVIEAPPRRRQGKR